MKYRNLISLNASCKQQGVAIIMVLLIVAIATSVAAYMALQQNLWQRQVESQFDRVQSRQLGLAGIEWARAILATDKQNTTIDHEKESWTFKLPAIPVESGEVLGSIEDRQGLFNLNNLNAANVGEFETLLGLLSLPPGLAAALVDWIDANDQVEPGGAEDGYYLTLPQPRRAANQPLVELGDLMNVKGFDSRTIESLRKFVSVLPDTNSKINVNFAPPEVLRSVFGLDIALGKSIAEQRKTQPFRSPAEFEQILKQNNLPLKTNKTTVETTYFWVTGTATVGNSQVETQALLRRTSAIPWASVVWQSVR